MVRPPDLQFRDLLDDRLAALLEAHSGPAATLEARAEAAVAALREELRRRAAERGTARRLLVRLDGALRTEAPEHLDDPDFPAERKLALVRALHLFNRAIGAYGRFWGLLRPLLREAAERGERVKLLELAAGAGHFSMELARRAHREGLALQVVATDVVEAQVRAARERAAAEGLPVDCRVLDATDADALRAERADVIFVAQSLHHFRPGLLARIVAAASEAARHAFVAVDGRRSLAKLLLVPGPTWLAPWTPHFHDALLSARKFYSEPELELVARLAAPRARVRVGPEGPYSVLLVRP